MVAAWAPAAAHAVDFTGPTNFPTGSVPRSITVADFDGDSNSDLVTANAGATNVSLLLGDGAGSFSGPTNFGVGSFPLALAVGDFNGDSDPDLVTANANPDPPPDTVSVLLGDGTGGFSAPTLFTAGGYANAIAVGDFDGDSDSDLAVANESTNNVSILLGNGAGSFSGPTNYGVGSGPHSVAVGNLNAGSDLDLAVANWAAFSNNVSILLGSTGGTFTGPTNFTSRLDAQSQSIAVKDFDGDSDHDLVTVNRGTGDVSIMLGDGTGSFTHSSNIGVGDTPFFVAVDEFDGNSDPDLAVANLFSNNVSILLGGTGASFTGPTNFGVGTAPESLAVGEFNGDSEPDLAVPNRDSNNVSVLLGAIAPAPPTLTDTVPASPANENSPRVRGTAEAGSTVRLYTSSDCSGSAAATGTAADFASPGLAVSVSDNSTTTFRGTATSGEASGCSSSSITYVEDSATPDTTITSGPSGPTSSTEASFEFSSSEGGSFECELDSGGFASCSSPETYTGLSEGSGHTFSVRSIDAAGNADPSPATRSWTVDTLAPAAPTLTATVPTSPANDNAPKMKGTAEAGSTVDLYKAPTTTDCTPANEAASGTAADFASLGLTVSVPDNSSTRFRATATDAAGNTSACSTSSRVYVEDSTPPGKPGLTATDPASPANHNSPKVKGTAAANTTVNLYRAATTSDCTPVNLAATGTAADFASTGLTVSVADNSSTRFRATATDAAGNTSPCSTSSRVYVEDSIAPGPPGVTATDPPSPANNTSPKVRGNAAANTTVTLYKAATTSDCTSTNLAATGTAADFTSAGITVSVTDNSSTRFRATATDAAGNTSACSTSSRVYVEDSIAPGKPTLTATDPASPANDNSPEVKGTAAANTTVRLYYAPTASDCTAPNQAATGTAAEFATPGITAPVADNSTTTFRATATDLAGNTSACSTSSIIYVEETPLAPMSLTESPGQASFL